MNGDWRENKGWARKAHAHLDTLRSRQKPLWIGAEREAWWEFSTDLALRNGLLRLDETGQHLIPLRIQNTAIQWFAARAWQQDDLSPQRLRKIADEMLSHLNQTPSKAIRP